MHFKRLELFGFKSFAERTVFHFEPGVTAIVGPNGCGKTNVVDAIRWSLGEQNARDLRGATMEDVIFNGTAALPPLGFAEVSLTLANDDRALPVDFTEVTVTRRVYRSGESEYLLNKLPVRLRDIQELFMGTGIGTESYSIIGQGKMNQVLSSKPEERRTVFEEASGITRYKTKKREALRKLDETEQNLLRVSDIVTEVQRQLRSIERLAEKARKYQERFDRLREAELTAAAIEFLQLTQQRSAAHADGQALEARAREITGRWEALRAQVEALSAERETLMHRLSRHQATRAELRGTIERHGREIELKTQWQQDLTRQSAVLDDECAALRATQRQLTEQTATTERALAAVRQEAEQSQARTQEREQQISGLEHAIAQAQRAMHTVKQALLEQTSQIAKVKSELAKLGATAHAQQGRIRRLRADHAELQRQAETIAQQRQTLQGERDQQAGEIAARTHALTQHQEERGQAEARAHTASDAVARLQQTRAQADTECQMLEELWRSHEGLAAGVKAVLDAQRPDVLGVVVDWLDVRAGWETAIESAIGDPLQALMVQETAHAWQVLQWLREQQHGRAHVIALDQTCTIAAGAAVPPVPGAIAATELVTLRDERLRAFVQAHLADVWVVPDLTAVTSWPSSAVRLVDQAGSVWSRGTLAGGKQASSVSIVGRRARLDAAQAHVADVRTNLAAEEQALAGAKAALAVAGQALEAQMQSLQELQRAHAACELRLAQLDESATRITDERDVVASELAEAEQEFQAIDTAIAHWTEQQTIADAALHALEAQLAEQQAALATHAHARETQLIELAALTANRDTVVARAEALASAVDDFAQRRQAAEQSLAGKQLQITESRSRAAQFEREVAEHRTAMAAVSADEARESETITTVERDVDARKQQLVALEPDVRREEAALESLHEEQRSNDAATAELGFKTQSLVDRIRDRYKCDVPPHEPTPDDATRLETLRAAIAVDREKLESIGPVSLGSISEQEELSQRATFLTTQQQDLAQAQAALKQAIQKINRETKQLFLDTFARIQQEFEYFFKLLFGGGKAELTLMDPEDVLDCGIEITASPPGKKLQSIALLSGGEQAMTAVALLFALFKVRPSPFCILDEIDAPLDEANVDRFTRGLNEFTKLSQFIIVTHNKKTITRGDVMYGITMEQAGVSKIVSVKFAETATPATISAAAAHPDPATISTPA